MAYEVPKWLIDAVANGGWGYQADLARHARIAKDKLNKTLSGTRQLRHDEAERLKEAIRTMASHEDQPDPTPLAPSQGSGTVRRVFSKTRATGRLPELVFLLNNGGYFVFQLEAPILAELREALEEIEAALPPAA